VEAGFVNLPAAQVSLLNLPDPIRRRSVPTADLPPTEQDLLLSALWSTDWNKSKAARQLRWSRTTLYRRLTRYQLIEEEQRKKPPQRALVQNCPVPTASGTKV
jgi:two-component system response regulator HydG/two-component system response regulator AtoC